MKINACYIQPICNFNHIQKKNYLSRSLRQTLLLATEPINTYGKIKYVILREIVSTMKTREIVQLVSEQNKEKFDLEYSLDKSMLY